VVVLISRYVSLASMVAVAVFPFAAGIIGQFYPPPSGLTMISLASLLILVKHRDNARRIFSGTESRLGAKHE
jgi:glycerol-3-phosphate acyltransferase PlsY